MSEWHQVVSLSAHKIWNHVFPFTPMSSEFIQIFIVGSDRVTLPEKVLKSAFEIATTPAHCTETMEKPNKYTSSRILRRNSFFEMFNCKRWQSSRAQVCCCLVLAGVRIPYIFFSFHFAKWFFGDGHSITKFEICNLNMANLWNMIRYTIRFSMKNSFEGRIRRRSTQLNFKQET